MPPYDLDIEDRDFRHDFSPEQLDALERRQATPEQRARAVDERPASDLQRRALRLVGTDRPRIEALHRGVR